MPRAPRLCPGDDGHCTNLIHNGAYCDDCTPKPWQGRTTGQGSTRATRAARRRCLEDANYQCQLRYAGCTTHATHADHITNIASTDTPRAEAITGLQAACTWCHGTKTRAEARAGRNAWKRQPERHPGRLR